jgi:mRNA interferase RelE/StbE
MRLGFTRSAGKQLAKLRKGQPDKAKAILDVLDRIAADPFGKHNNLTPLEGVEDGYRLRVGDWRVSYKLFRDEDVLEVFEVETRGGAYR